MDLKSLLSSRLKRIEDKKQENISDSSDLKVNADPDLLFEKYYNEWKGLNDGETSHKTTYGIIPKFYHKLPSDDDQLRLKLREESRSVFLQRRSRELLENEELKNLWVLLDKHQSSPNLGGDEQMINYDDFLKVSELAGPKCKQYFLPSTFCKLLQNDPYGRISIMNFFNYVMRKVWLHQTRIGLSLYDVSGQGYLRESDLESYILDLIPTLPQLHGLEKSFHSFYVCTAVRKFFFFLDPLHTGQIKIQDILACSFLDDLLELRDEDLPKDQQQNNWFSAPSALRVYGIYLNLDKDHNGMLSKEELSKYGMGTLTQVFIDRVFQECLTYEGEMDYKTYLDFVLALENQKEPQALHYFFKILDIDGNGYLNTFTLNYFFRSIQQQMRQHNQEPVNFEDVKDEIYDMVKPINALKITLQDLINCGQGEVVVSILIDLNGFWTYENREVLVSDVAEDGRVNNKVYYIGKEKMSLKPPDPVYVLRGALHPISSTAFSLPETHDGTVKYLASGTQQGLVSIWNLKVRGTQMNWQAHKSSVLWLKFVESFKLWTEGRNDAAILWDINDGSAKEICQFPINQYLGFSQCNVIKLGDRSYLSVPGPSQESVTLWDVNSCIKICTLTPSDVKLCGSVMQCRWIQSESNLYILIIYESGQLCLWDWPNRKILSEINCKDNPIYVEYDETLARGICGTVSEKVFSFLLHKESAKLEYETEFSIKNPGIGCIATRPDSKIYAMGGWDHRIRLYSWKKHKPLAVLFYHKNSIECLDFSKGPVETLSKGYLLAAGSGDNSISLWDIYN